MFLNRRKEGRVKEGEAISSDGKCPVRASKKWKVGM